MARPEPVPERATLRGILFDLDDTLADSTGVELAVWPSVVRVIGARVPHVDAALLRERYEAALENHYPALLEGEIDFTTFRRRRLREALEPWHELDDELFEAYTVEKARCVEELRPFEDALATLRTLRARGIRVGVLTNGPSGLQRRKLETSGLRDELDAIAISEEIGAAKPDPAAFRAALALLGCGPHEAAMVGDNLEKDIAGALGAGLAAAVWVRRRPGAPPDGAHLALEVAEVPRLLGLPG